MILNFNKAFSQQFFTAIAGCSWNNSDYPQQFYILDRECRLAAHHLRDYPRDRVLAAFLATLRVRDHQAELGRRIQDHHGAHSLHGQLRGLQYEIRDLLRLDAMAEEVTHQTTGRGREAGVIRAVPHREMDRQRRGVQR